ncbi:MAG: zinc metallopeptidase [Clostridiales bacterium]|nr:zinc metallopeptidase [Clostridiales bacterium]
MFFYYVYYGSLIVLIPGIIFSIWAQYRISSTFKKYSREEAKSRWTANEMSMMLLERNDCKSVAVRRIGGNLTDNYNPSTDVLSLSNSTYGQTSISAIGVAAHECGHAVQKHSGSILLRLRSFLVPITNIGSRLAVPIAILGVILEWLIVSETGTNFGSYVVAIGILLYSLSTVFALITLPVEIDASRRAITMLKNTAVLDDEEIRKASKVLYAAALTYVAALLTSFLYLIRFILILGRYRRND